MVMADQITCNQDSWALAALMEPLRIVMVGLQDKVCIRLVPQFLRLSLGIIQVYMDLQACR